MDEARKIVGLTPRRANVARFAYKHAWIPRMDNAGEFKANRVGAATLETTREIY